MTLGVKCGAQEHSAMTAWALVIFWVFASGVICSWSDFTILAHLLGTTSSPSFDLSVVRDTNENREDKNAPVKSWGQEALERRDYRLSPPFARSSPPGFRAVIFFSRFSFASRTTHKAKEGACSLNASNNRACRNKRSHLNLLGCKRVAWCSTI